MALELLPPDDEALANVLDLPEGCLTHILRFLSPQDLAAAAQTCRSFCMLSASSVVWVTRLREDLDLPLQVRLRSNVFCNVTPGTVLYLTADQRYHTIKQAVESKRDWKADYKQLMAVPTTQPLRFLGSYTDGGCDDELNQYWVGSSGRVPWQT